MSSVAEALLKERDAAYAERDLHIRAAELMEQEIEKLQARAERLEAALRSIIGWLEDPKGGSHEEDMREASRIASTALKGADHE